jgi:hypothetical protein
MAVPEQLAAAEDRVSVVLALLPQTLRPATNRVMLSELHQACSMKSPHTTAQCVVLCAGVGLGGEVEGHLQPENPDDSDSFISLSGPSNCGSLTLSPCLVLLMRSSGRIVGGLIRQTRGT